MYKSKCALLASDFTAETMSGYAQEPRGKFGKVHVKQNPRIEQWEQETGGVTTERVYASNTVSGADGYNKPGMRFQSPPRIYGDNIEHVSRPMVVAADAMGRIVSSYISPNPDKDGVIRKAEMVIEAYERRDNGDKYSGSGMHLIPAPKLSNNATKAEEMAEQVLSAVTNRLNRPGGTNEYGRMGLGGMFRPQQPNFNSTDGWGRHTDTTVRAQPTYNDGYRGEFDGGRGSGPTAADEWSNRPSSTYPSTQAYNDGYRGEFDGGRGSGPTAADAWSNRASSAYPSTPAYNNGYRGKFDGGRDSGPTATDAWSNRASSAHPSTQAYNDGYRGEFDGGRGSGPTAADARSNRASSVYPSTQASLPTQPAIDSREAARRYNGKLV